MRLEPRKPEDKQAAKIKRAFRSKARLYKIECLFSEIVRPEPYVMSYWGDCIKLPQLHSEKASDVKRALSAIKIMVKGGYDFVLPVPLFVQMQNHQFVKLVDEYIKSVFSVSKDTAIRQEIMMFTGFSSRAFSAGYAEVSSADKFGSGQESSQLNLTEDKSTFDYAQAFIEVIKAATALNKKFIEEQID